MDKEFLKGLPCDKDNCRLMRLPNVSVFHGTTPEVVDRKGNVVEPAKLDSEIAYEVSCSTCGKTFSQPEKNGVKGNWAEKA